MKIEKVNPSDVDEILGIYSSARRFMRETGNPSQWADNYPSTSVICTDIKEQRLYKITDGSAILGVFCFFIGEEPTYREIYEGEWESAAPCGVIHRVAISDSARGKGISGKIFDYCSSISPYLRIDTHRDNTPMQKALEKFGFTRRGIIYLANGDERIAFDYCRRKDN
jgi:RimJ/RimL family protein N-acetyltransferase